ncbi:hypothetical protein GDO78_023187 [Eleutherodactylus coqui]|uniref:Uncharacterized protein n=1 Tax=Eleutherodactylus coqui TaxID=57060 RepID=A0A8J6BFT0_ELECQ|nr:hypothetical protein GDO78_023187 [Eleutherodactylus coqui]
MYSHNVPKSQSIGYHSYNGIHRASLSCTSYLFTEDLSCCEVSGSVCTAPPPLLSADSCLPALCSQHDKSSLMYIVWILCVLLYSFFCCIFIFVNYLFVHFSTSRSLYCHCLQE